MQSNTLTQPATQPATQPNFYKVGQVYECTQKDHKGWRVELVKISANHVEARALKGNRAYKAKAHTTNGNFNYTLDQFRRDYQLIQAIEELPAPPLEYKTCPECGESKQALGGFGKFPRGYGFFDTCKSCRAKRSAATRKAKQASITMQTYGEPQVGHTLLLSSTAENEDAASIAIKLLDLAKAVEQLDTPPSLIKLATAVRDVILDSTDADVVVVVPAAQYKALEAAYNSIKGQINWPS